MAHPDLDELLNALLPFAQQMLAKHGEFFPFGACMTSDGTIEMLAGQPDDSDQPPSQDVIDVLTEALRRKAEDGAIRAAGVCYDVRVRQPDSPDPTDAVCASLDHEAGDSVNVLLPYRSRRFRSPTYGDLQATPC